ncbi:hypothetical protein, partial [Streptomyces sp. NPDC055109]
VSRPDQISYCIAYCPAETTLDELIRIAGSRWAIVSLDPTGTGRNRWTTRWKRALKAFDIAFDGRLTNSRI